MLGIKSLFDFVSGILGHRVYGEYQLSIYGYHQLYCTCGGRITAINSLGKPTMAYWLIIESNCSAVNLALKLFPSVRSDFPFAKASNVHKK